MAPEYHVFPAVGRDSVWPEQPARVSKRTWRAGAPERIVVLAKDARDAVDATSIELLPNVARGLLATDREEQISLDIESLDAESRAVVRELERTSRRLRVPAPAR